LIWSWYSIGETPVASDTEAKLRQLLRGLLGRESGAVVLISSPCVADCSGTGKLLERFLRAMGPSLASAAAEYQEEP
jgi:EpsI family protein